MKQILVSVDFSASSLNAFNHSIGIAEKFNSGILLKWNECKNSKKLLNLKKGEEAKKIAEKKILELIEDFKVKNIEIRYTFTKGKTYQEIVKLSEREQSDLIVFGCVFTPAIKRFFMGDDANKLIANAKAPVLTFHENRGISEELKKIVIAIDNTLDTRQKLPITMEFAKKFGAEVHVLGIYTSSVSTIMMRVDSYVKQAFAGLRTKGIPNEVHFIKTTNISKSTIKYAKEVNANLIITMVDTEYFTSDIFLGKQPQQMVNHSSIPVLSLRNKQLIKTNIGF